MAKKRWNDAKPRSRNLTGFLHRELSEKNQLRKAETGALNRSGGYVKGVLGTPSRERDGDLLVSEFLLLSEYAGYDPREALAASGAVEHQHESDLSKFLNVIRRTDDIPHLAVSIENKGKQEVSESELKKIQELGWDDPVRAYDELKKYSYPDFLKPLAYTIGASCYRMADRHVEAAHMLREGWLWTPTYDRRTKCRIYRKAVYVLDHVGETGRAISSGEQAVIESSILGDSKLKGKSLADLAYPYLTDEKFSHFLEINETVYRLYFSDLSKRYRMAVLQHLGLANHKLGDNKKASYFLDLALESQDEMSNPRTTGKTLWLAAMIDIASKRFLEGHEKYDLAFEVLKDESPIDALLLASEAIQTDSGFIDHISRICAHKEIASVPAVAEALLKTANATQGQIDQVTMQWAVDVIKKRRTMKNQARLK